MIKRGAMLMVFLLLSWATVVLSEPPMAMPPSVPEARWVPIGERAGMEIFIKPFARSRGEYAPFDAVGQLWIKVDGIWAPARFPEKPQLFHMQSS
jgi:hypothetical protein